MNEHVLQFAISQEPSPVVSEMIQLEKSYGQAALGIVVFVVVVRVMVWASVRVYREVFKPHQEGQKALANSRVSEAKAMTETAMSLDSTARELSTAARVQKETAETQRATTAALTEQMERLSDFLAGPKNKGTSS